MKKLLLTAGVISVLGASLYGFSYADSNNVAHKTQNDNNISVSPQLTIQEKMLNAIDYYSEIKGTYTATLRPINVDEVVSFQIKQGESPASNVNIHNKKSGEILEFTFDGENQLIYRETTQEFKKEKLAKVKPFDKQIERKSTTNGEPTHLYRPDPAYAYMAKDVAFPQVYAFWLDDESKYQILGHETYLDRDAVVIEGEMDPFVGKKHDSVRFKMWVDNQTGVLLKLVETNTTGEITNKIEVQELTINGGVDETKFSTTPPAGAKDKSQK